MTTFVPDFRDVWITRLVDLISRWPLQSSFYTCVASSIQGIYLYHHPSAIIPIHPIRPVHPKPRLCKIPIPVPVVCTVTPVHILPV